MIKYKKLATSVFVVIFLLLFVVPAFAWDWEDISRHPSPFTGREYTREHWTRFSLNEYYSPYAPNIFQDGRSVRRGNAYCSVFDLPNNLTEGYTAVTGKDKSYSFNNNGETAQEKITNLSNLEGMYLSAYQFVRSGDAYIVSPAWYNNMENAKLWLKLDKSGCAADVPIYRKHCSAMGYCDNIPVTRHVDNPVCLKKNTPPADIAGGYDGNLKQKRIWYSQKTGNYGSVNLTKNCAVAMYTFNGNMTSADVMVAYPYGLSMSELRWTGGRNYSATIFNTTPYLAKNVKFRAYILTADGHMLKQDEKTGDISATSNEYGWGKYTYNFTVSPQPEDYQVIATANIEASSGLNNGATLENLVTQYAYGTLINNFTFHESGGMQETIAVLPWGGKITSNRAYDDNYKIVSAEGETPPITPPGPEPPAGEDNLSCFNLKAYDFDTGQEITSYTAGKPMKAKAWYNSTFDIGGWAKLRLYTYNQNYQQLHQINGDVNYFVEPNAEFTYDGWGGFALGTGEYKLVASIDLYNNTDPPNVDANWQHELFDGVHEETTYDDNKYVKDLTGSEAPYEPPEPVEWSQSGWYPPVGRQEIPGEITRETIRENIYGWRPIPLVRNEPEIKKKVRLVPNRPE